MALRYDQETKDEILAFIEQFNAANGRGGQTAAVKKFKVSPLSIGNWMKKAGAKKSGRKAKVARAPKEVAVKRRGRGPGKAKASAATAAPASASAPVKSSNATLQRMMDISQKIDALQAEFDQLKGRL